MMRRLAVTGGSQDRLVRMPRHLPATGLVAYGLSLLLAASAPGAAETQRAILDQYCVACHQGDAPAGSLRLDEVDVDRVAEAPVLWEKVVHKLRTGTMPPLGVPAPAPESRAGLLSWLETSLDAAAETQPDPGRTESLRRLNRTEYRNAIRDLLAVEIDVDKLLPHDESGHGFDNVNLGDLSPSLLERYVSAAQKIGRLAVGTGMSFARTEFIRVKPDFTQERHVPGLPVGSRGGVAVSFPFPQDADYEFRIWLTRNRNEEIEGLNGEHEIHLLVDRERVRTFTVKPPTDRFDHAEVDQHLRARVPVSAGPHDLAVTFPQASMSLLETKRQPTQSRFNMHRHPRTAPAVFQISVTGPLDATGPGDTPSRRRLFTCRPASVAEETDCARRILGQLARRAFRRPVSDEDMAGPMEFYRKGHAVGGFDVGIERALTAVLVSPKFLLRVELDPPDVRSHEAYAVNDFDLASRLSFFLWSSIPDDELLDAAARGELRSPEGIERQARRMLADPRASNLATNFGGQWLHLGKLASFSPDGRLFPDFDDNLRDALREETERLVESVLREDRSVLDLIRADYTFLNERLARHYRIPGVYGSRFRRVELDGDSRRGGLLRQGSVLTVTSYPTRTSPVLRGTWLLENVFGAPPPAPPPNVPALDGSVSADLPMRERLQQHRDNPACASCHQTIDPVGFALENFDALGRWRDYEDGRAVDVTGGLPGFEPSDRGVDALEASLLERPDLFAATLARKLMTFALGRGVEHADAPAIRTILRDARTSDYRFSDLVVGIVRSVPFRMRKAA